MRRAGAVLASVLCLVASQASASEWVVSEAVGKVFKDAGATGTFVLYDVAADRYTVHERKRAETRFVPASTFKIPNTLIALTVDSVDGVDQVLPYGGKKQMRKEWEKDMSLRDAIKVSNVPVYKELARRTGMARMQAQVNRLNYGNKELGGTVDTFWLVGPLKISAVEQVRFLAGLADDKLPFPKEAMAHTREIVLQEKKGETALYAKTGWTDAHTPDLGWWVGWVSKEGKTYAFALNLDIPDGEDGAKRVSVGKASLAVLGLAP